MTNEVKTKDTQKEVNIGEILKNAWDLFIKNINLFIILGLIAVGLMLIPAILTFFTGLSFAGLSGLTSMTADSTGMPVVSGLFATVGVSSIILISIVTLIVVTWMMAASTYAVYNVVSGKTVTAWDNYKLGLKKFWVFLGMSIVATFLVGIGLILLIIPGIIAAIFLSYAYYLLVAENLTIGKAISRSFELAKRSWVSILVLVIILAAIGGVLGMIPVVNLIASPIMSIFGTLVIALLYGKVK